MYHEVFCLKEEVQNTPIIVEGKNDKRPLSKLGFNNIYTISGQPLFYVADKISSQHKSVVILTDFDREGKKKAELLTKFFNSLGTKTLADIRRKFHRLFRVVKIEEMNALVETLESNSDLTFSEKWEANLQ